MQAPSLLLVILALVVGLIIVAIFISMRADYSDVDDFDSDYEPYFVKHGDNLYEIAARHEVTVDELREWNDLGPHDFLKLGQYLRIRKKSDICY